MKINKVTVTILIFLGTVGFVFLRNELTTKKTTINSFEECIEAGNPVLESYPRQCKAGGKTFVEKIEEEYNNDERAERRGFEFMQNFAASAPPNPDSEAQLKAYDALSENAREKVNKDSISKDLVRFIGVQDVPDQGVSIEDLQVENVSRAVLTVGLNYSGSGRVLRDIHLVKEEGVWRVDMVTEAENGRFN